MTRFPGVVDLRISIFILFLFRPVVKFDTPSSCLEARRSTLEQRPYLVRNSDVRIFSSAEALLRCSVESHKICQIGPSSALGSRDSVSVLIPGLPSTVAFALPSSNLIQAVFKRFKQDMVVTCTPLILC